MLHRLILVLGFLGATPLMGETWKIVADTHFPPYNFRDSQGKVTGLDTEIVEAVLKQIPGAVPQFQLKPWKRVMEEAFTNTVDMAFQWKWTRERQNKPIILVGPLRAGKTVFATRVDSGIKDWDSMEDLKNYTFCVIRGYKYAPVFDSYRNKLKITVEASDTNKLILTLVNKRCQMAIGDQASLAYELRQQGTSNQIHFLPKVIKLNNRYVAFPTQRAAKAAQFEHALNAVRESGELAQILERWL